MSKVKHAKLPEDTQKFFDHVELKLVNSDAKFIVGPPGHPNCAQVKAVEVNQKERKIVVEPTEGSYLNLKKQLANDNAKVTIYVENVPFATKCAGTSVGQKSCTLFF
jgi:hypothetical protein